MRHSRFRRAVGLAGALCLLALPSAAWAGAGSLPETGLWIDDTGRGAVKIEVCGNTLCGRIYWLREKTDSKGRQLTDRHNPDPAKQTRPICGLPVIGNLRKMTDGTFDAGWVYDPKVGKSYSLSIQLANKNTLQLTGYAGIKLLGKTFYWKRAESELPACSEADNKAGGDPLPWAAN